MPYSKSSFDHLNTLVDTITTRYRVGYFSLSSRLHDTFTTSHIVKEQPNFFAWQCQMQALDIKHLHLAMSWPQQQTTDKCECSTRNARSGKEVIQPHLPVRLPCYDFTPVMNPAVVIALLAVRLTTSGKTHSHGVTGGVYKTRERIHRGMLIRDY